jgi:aspartate/methionine/tyrosine aminotransferase
MRESIIRRTTIRAAELGAVNLSQGFPDDDTFPELKQFATEAIAGCNHQYTDPWGAPVLRAQIAKKLRQFNGIDAHPDRNIVVTCGATEGMMDAMEALVPRGSEIITFAPTYENYVLQAIAAGVELRTISLWEPDFSFRREQLEAVRSDRTRAILICNPWNPTGKVYRREELQSIVEFASDHDLLIFCDETYEYLIWPGHRHISIASLQGAAPRTVTVTSMGKTYSVTGWRVGYAVADEPLTEEIRKMHDFHTVTAPHPFQIALARAVDLPEAFYGRLRRDYLERKAILCDALTRAGMTYYDPGGAYFLWCDYSAVSDEEDTIFQEKLLAECGVAGVPGSVFYPLDAPNPRRMRFTFSKSRATIEAAAARLTKAGVGR